MYHKSPLFLSEDHLYRLARGQPVQISHHNTHGHKNWHQHEVYLTNGQCDRIKTAIHNEKKTKLSLSKKQISHHVEKGEGFFSDLVRKIHGVAKSVVEKIKPHLTLENVKKVYNHELINPILKHGENHAKVLALHAAANVGTRVKKEIDSLARHGHHAIADLRGKGMSHNKREVQLANLAKGRAKRMENLRAKREGRTENHSKKTTKHHQNHQHGNGLSWDDFKNGISSAYNSVAKPLIQDVGIPLVSSVVAKTIRGGSLRKRGRKPLSGRALYG